MKSRRAFLRSSIIASAGLLAACQPEEAPEPVGPTETLIQIPTAKPTPTSTIPIPTATRSLEPRVLAKDLDFPEGPAFDPQGRLWCTELNAGNLVLVGDGVRRFPTGGRPNGLAFDASGRGCVCDSKLNTIRRFNSTDANIQLGTVVDKIDEEPLLAPNDLAFDASGNLVFTCPNGARSEAAGYVACLKPDGTVVKIAEGFFYPNGVDFINDGKTLVVADTQQKKLFKGEWDAETTTWMDPQPWVNVGGAIGPDGMVPGADGLLYVAIFGDGVLRVVDPRQSEVVQEIKLPGSNPTNAAIDPSGRLGLVVSETQTGTLLSLPWIKPGAVIFKGSQP